jgi:hypothetical protein
VALVAGAVVAGAVIVTDRTDSRSDGATPTTSIAPGATTTEPAATASSPNTAGPGPSSAGTTPTSARREPTIEAAGDLDAQPSAAGAPTSAPGAPGLYASFELGLDRTTTAGPVVGLTWPAQAVSGFDHYVVLRRTEPGSPDEVAVATRADPAATTFSQDLAAAVADGTSTVSFRTGVVDASGAIVKVSTTLTVRLSWP